MSARRRPWCKHRTGTSTERRSSGGKQRCGQLHDGCGTIFRIGLDGSFTTLHVFNGRDGANAEGALIQGADGALYGTTSGGGKNGDGLIFRLVI